MIKLFILYTQNTFKLLNFFKNIPWVMEHNSTVEIIKNEHIYCTLIVSLIVKLLGIQNVLQIIKLK